jgi:hypothetical protein
MAAAMLLPSVLAMRGKTLSVSTAGKSTTTFDRR